MNRLWLSGLFVAVLTISNIIANKIVSVGIWIVPAAIFAYPITFALTDIISEIYGKKAAKQVVWLGLWANVLLVGFVQLAIYLPPAPFYQLNDAFKNVLGGTFRIVIASLIAYLVSQSHDVWAFHMWKKLTKGKHLWLRNNASTMVSQLIDSVLFISIAFYGIVPNNVLINMILSQYSIKLIIALIDTPFVYLVVKFLTGKWEVKEY